MTNKKGSRDYGFLLYCLATAPRGSGHKPIRQEG